METNDLILISGKDGSLMLFRVYANELLLPDDLEMMVSIAGQETAPLILVTCENETADGGYLNRRVIFAKEVM